MRSLAWGFILPGLPLLAIMAGLDHGAKDSLTGVESKRFSTRDFRLESGAVLPEVKIAYETYGQLAGNGCNTVLMTHGYTSDHHAAG